MSKCNQCAKWTTDPNGVPWCSEDVKLWGKIPSAMKLGNHESCPSFEPKGGWLTPGADLSIHSGFPEALGRLETASGLALDVIADQWGVQRHGVEGVYDFETDEELRCRLKHIVAGTGPSERWGSQGAAFTAETMHTVLTSKGLMCPCDECGKAREEAKAVNEKRKEDAEW